MSKKTFTDAEVKQLSKNPYVRSVSNKAITYTDAFKQLFISENNKGKLPREIFEECGFDVTIVAHVCFSFVLLRKTSKCNIHFWKQQLPCINS